MNHLANLAESLESVKPTLLATIGAADYNRRCHLAFYPYTEAAHAFVYSTFWDSMRAGTTMSKDERVACEKALKRAMVEPSTKAVLLSPAGHPEELLGWAVATPDCLLYVYVRFDYRRGKMASVLGEEGRQVGNKLIEQVDGPWMGIPAAIWTKDASQMAANGFPIRYDLEQHARFMELAR